MSLKSPKQRPQEELFPIGAVVEKLQQSYPDVSHSSLRFLEREGLLTSTRTKGGHRLFRQSDIDRIRRIKQWQLEGMSLEAIRQRLAEYDALPDPDQLSAEFLRTALARDTESASRLVLAADDAGLPLEVTFGEVLGPALVSLGDLWEKGEVPVAQEKEVSELSRDLVAVLSRRHRPASPDGPQILAACVEGELHEIGLRMICGLLREAGYAVRYLGANVAPRFLLDAARLHQPDLIILSVSLEENIQGVRDAIEALRAGLEPEAVPPILVGGDIAETRKELLESWGATVVPSANVTETLDAISAVLPARNVA